MPYAQFAEAFLRRWGDLLHLPGHGWMSAEALRTLFLREYERLRPTSPARYNAGRKDGTPSAMAIARALTLEGTWEALLAHLGLTRCAATAPRGQACAAATDSPAQRLERYLECFREHEARVEAALVRAEARARTQPAAKRAPRGTFDGAYETNFSIGARASEKR